MKTPWSSGLLKIVVSRPWQFMSIDNISSVSTPVLLSFHGTSCSGSFRYNMAPSATPTALPVDLVVAVQVQSSSDKGFEPLIGHSSTTDRNSSDRAPATTTRFDDNGGELYHHGIFSCSTFSPSARPKLGHSSFLPGQLVRECTHKLRAP